MKVNIRCYGGVQNWLRNLFFGGESGLNSEDYPSASFEERGHGHKRTRKGSKEEVCGGEITCHGDVVVVGLEGNFGYDTYGEEEGSDSRTSDGDRGSSWRVKWTPKDQDPCVLGRRCDGVRFRGGQTDVSVSPVVDVEGW